MSKFEVVVKNVTPPKTDGSKQPVLISKETAFERKNKVISLMQENGFSSLIIYADKEHGGSFEYLTGFIPRFEEALQILNVDGTSTLILGNENYNKTKYSLVDSEGILCPLFSLPNQPMGNFKPVDFYLEQAAIDQTEKVGLVDWKLLSNDFLDFHSDSAIPAFIIEGLKKVVPENKLANATQLYIDPEKGARVTNNANEIARYEYGAALASDSILNAMNALKEGVSEQEIGNLLQADGQLPNVVTISAFGDRFTNANIYPLNTKLEYGNKVAITNSHKGGLSSRSGYAVRNEEDLNEVDENYLEEVVKPYFAAYNFWFDNIEIGKNGGEFYDEFSAFYPQEQFGWELNPGHLTADEEWLASPFFSGSDKTVQSGMIFQVDFIPNQEGHHGVSAESTVAIADAELRKDIENKYPELWERIQNRRAYMRDELNIELKEELLPLCSTLAYYRPFFLNPDKALTLK
ncbi:MAG TPA: M24 family metallopeptidase [Atopostipes sp.]|nr:M24 family metallopeptidase [Atopostipes sp.]